LGRPLGAMTIADQRRRDRAVGAFGDADLAAGAGHALHASTILGCKLLDHTFCRADDPVEIAELAHSISYPSPGRREITMTTLDLNRLSVERYLNGKPHNITGEMPLRPGVADASAVSDFLGAHAAELQLGVDPGELKLVHQADTPVRKVYRYQKTIGGIPVHNAFVIVHVDHQDRVRKIEVTHQAQLPAVDARGGQDIGAQAAREKALKSVGDVKLRATKPEPEKMYFPTDA